MIPTIHWTDYTCGSERGHAGGIPIAFSDAARVPEGEL